MCVLLTWLLPQRRRVMMADIETKAIKLMDSGAETDLIFDLYYSLTRVINPLHLKYRLFFVCIS